MKHEFISKIAAEEGTVLLKNEDNILPLKSNSKIAVFGRGQYEFFAAGRGSGNVNSTYSINITQGLKNSGFLLDEKIDKIYKLGNNATKSQISAASKRTPIAVVVISRNSTEFWDREIKDDFNLTKDEIKLFKNLEESDFNAVIVILNIAEPIQMTFLKEFTKIKGLILAWLPGMEGGNAIANIISGKVNPSGKLTDTLAWEYEMYPCAKRHHQFADTVYYEEDIFVGYRYFETVSAAKDNVAYPFGYGLSYTKFEITAEKPVMKNEKIIIGCSVKNIGKIAGKEVAQLYVKHPLSGVLRPALELKGFKKTKKLKVDEKQEFNFSLSESDLACFDEQNGAWIIQSGIYEFFVGNSVRNLSFAGKLKLKEKTVQNTGLKLNCMLPQRFNANGEIEKSAYFNRGELSKKAAHCEYIPIEKLKKANGRHTLYDVLSGKLKLSQFIDEFSIEEMINLCQAQPPAIPRGTAGIGNNLLRGIPNIQTADGPAGLRVSTHTTCFPCETLIACTWNPGIQRNVGKAMGEECTQHNIDILLAPALNIHRDPLCGRNFEYYSEDPLVSGKTAVQVVKGIESTGVAATIKHFICNNTERFRIFSNSIVSERALREIYLKGFEIAVKEGKPKCLMTSYNLINNIRSSSNFGLLNGILREEWKYKGVVMTDWRTDSHLFEEINAGNNVKMPFGYPDEIDLAMNYAALNNLDVNELKKSVRFILNLILKSRRFKNRDFGPVNTILGNGASCIKAIDLNCVSHTFCGIEDCSDKGGGKSLRRLEKDMRGNDCFVSYTIDVKKAGEYELTVRFSAEDASSYMEIFIDEENKGIIPGLNPQEESREWDEDDPNDPKTPKKWVTSEKLQLRLESGIHNLKIYIRTQKPRRTMSLNYLNFEKVKK